MTYTITRQYMEDDPKFMGDEVNVTLTDHTGKDLYLGDYYHDKIDQKIEGYLLAVEHMMGEKPKTKIIRETTEDY